VSKRFDKPYRSGRSGDWIKTKNSDKPGDATGSRRAGEGRVSNVNRVAGLGESVAQGNARRDRALLQCEPLNDFAVD
jgi:hypothetical protein